MDWTCVPFLSQGCEESLEFLWATGPGIEGNGNTNPRQGFNSAYSETGHGHLCHSRAFCSSPERSSHAPSPIPKSPTPEAAGLAGMCLGWEFSPAEPLSHTGPGEGLGTTGSGLSCKGRRCPQSQVRFQRQGPVQQFKAQLLAGCRAAESHDGYGYGNIHHGYSFFRPGNEFPAIPL